jgi:hypothetical protein
MDCVPSVHITFRDMENFLNDEHGDLMEGYILITIVHQQCTMMIHPRFLRRYTPEYIQKWLDIALRVTHRLLNTEIPQYALKEIQLDLKTTLCRYFKMTPIYTMMTDCSVCFEESKCGLYCKCSFLMCFSCRRRVLKCPQCRQLL